MSYTPLKITGNATGLVQERENFLLPNDAYPILQNAYVWRERIKRKKGCQLLGRLERFLAGVSIGNTLPSGTTFNIFNVAVPPITETNAQIDAVSIGYGAITYTDNGDGTLSSITPGNSGVINYVTGDITLTYTGVVGVAASAQINYFPGLPVMGLRIRDQTNAQVNQTVAFDTVYAYKFNGTTWEEFLPGTTWTGSNSQFFWTTNYWIDNANRKIFWATNNNDPIRYTNGVAATNWIDFAPQINAAGDTLQNALCLLPFRGRLVSFNTTEGQPGIGVAFTNRIRWAAIGTPFTVVSAIVTTVNANAWRDDIRGQGGFLDIPTSEDIVSVGFVRDNLVIYCEHSTWQLRYTGRSIAPFQIEKVNSELGAEGTFSTVQFDTSLVGIGDKGIVECDSFKSQLIDVKIPDLVFNFQGANDGPSRVHGIRDFINRLAYWTYPSSEAQGTYPDKRLVYNYENDSWAIFDDSYTTLGTIQVQGSRTWLNTHLPWVQCNFPWVNQVLDDPEIIGGNQQGFVEYLDEQNTNDISLFIQDITANTTTPTVITSPSHNLQTGAIIKISGIPSGTPFDNLNNIVFQTIVLNANTFQLMIFDSVTQKFSSPQLDVPGDPYVGKGNIAVLDNFYIESKKFNFLDEGQNIKLGYLDILMNSTEPENDGSISLYVFVDYNDNETINTLPQNVIADGSSNLPDGFFNQIIPTTPAAFNLNNSVGSKFWQRVYCPCRGNFLTLAYTLSDAQMNGIQQRSDVQIDAQILWVRQGGRMTQF